MDNKEKISMLEDLFDLEGGSLLASQKLEEIDEYDSMAKLSLIVLMDDEFDKKLTGEQIRQFKTIQDILDFMG